MKRKFVLKIKKEYSVIAIFVVLALLSIYLIDTWSNNSINQLFQSLRPCTQWTLFTNLSDDSGNLYAFTFQHSNATCKDALMQRLSFPSDNGSSIILTVVNCSQECEKY